MFMSGKLLLFSFEELPTILAAAAAAGPFGAEGGAGGRRSRPACSKRSAIVLRAGRKTASFRAWI